MRGIATLGICALPDTSAQPSLAMALNEKCFYEEPVRAMTQAPVSTSFHAGRPGSFDKPRAASETLLPMTGLSGIPYSRVRSLSLDPFMGDATERPTNMGLPKKASHLHRR